MSPFDTARLRSYLLGLLREQKRELDKWLAESLAVQQCKRHGLVSSAADVIESLSWLEEHGLAQHRNVPDRVLSVTTRYWAITAAGIDVINGTVAPPAGLRGD